jgi:hypothetical protein
MLANHSVEPHVISVAGSRASNCLGVAAMIGGARSVPAVLLQRGKMDREMPEILAGKQLAERVRAALIEHALAAHADAGIRGLCAQGAWEAAVGALRSLDLDPICRTPAEPR